MQFGYKRGTGTVHNFGRSFATRTWNSFPHQIRPTFLREDAAARKQAIRISNRHSSCCSSARG